MFFNGLQHYYYVWFLPVLIFQFLFVCYIVALNKGRGLKFCVGFRVQQTPEENQRTYQPKQSQYNKKDEDNSSKTQNDKNQQVSSKKIRQLMTLSDVATFLGGFHWKIKFHSNITKFTPSSMLNQSFNMHNVVKNRKQYYMHWSFDLVVQEIIHQKLSPKS